MLIKSYHLIDQLDDSTGGPARSVPTLVSELSKYGVESTILSADHINRPSNDTVEAKGLVWHPCEPKGILKLRYSPHMEQLLRSFVVKNQHDSLLHTHNLWNYVSYLSYRISKKHNMPLVISPRGSLFPWPLSQRVRFKKFSLAMFQRKSLNQSACVHVTSTSELEAVRSLGVSAPIALIPNGVDIEEFADLGLKSDCKSRLLLPLDKRNILFFSRIHPKKRLDVLVEVFVEIASQFSGWNLLVAGADDDNEYYKQIQQKVFESGLADRVKFLGLVTGSERKDVFGASDLFVLPTYSENFGMSIAEALSARLPVITTTGAPWSSIADCSAGWWIDLSKEALQAAMREAISMSPESLAVLGESGRKIIEGMSCSAVASNMCRVYSWVLGAADKPEFVLLD